MSKFRIGDIEIRRVEETLGLAAEASAFFREYSQDELAPHIEWLSPDHYDPDSGKIVGSVHSWLLRTDKHVVLIDTCAGNHKPRPGMPRWDMLDTAYLGRLAAAGVRP